MTELPEPPTPAEADLRGLPYMKFFGDRLFASTTWLRASAEGRCAALRLWWHAFAKEVPAGSLPDDDALLAVHAGYGVAIKAFAKIRDEAMRGWFKATDGRLYHKVVGEIVTDAWAERLVYNDRRQKWRDKKQRQRGKTDLSPGDAGNVPHLSPEKTVLRERERERIPPAPKQFGKGEGLASRERHESSSSQPAPETGARLRLCQLRSANTARHARGVNIGIR